MDKLRIECVSINTNHNNLLYHTHRIFTSSLCEICLKIMKFIKFHRVYGKYMCNLQSRLKVHLLTSRCPKRRGGNNLIIVNLSGRLAS